MSSYLISRTMYVTVVLNSIVSCNGVYKEENANGASIRENASTGSEMVLDTFAKTKFNSRAEELVYIRKYIEFKLPKVLIEAEPKYMEKALEELVGEGKNITVEEAVKYTRMYNGAYTRLWYLVTENDLTFTGVKKRLISYKTLYPHQQQKVEETVFASNSQKTENVELPPAAEIEINNYKSIYPDYLDNLETYSPKVSLVCQDQGYSDCLRDVTEIVKELVEIKAKHSSNKDNPAYLKYYNSELAILKQRNWVKDAKSIEQYISENIKIYENTLKECDCENEDWFNKIPKDLYKYFNLK